MYVCYTKDLQIWDIPQAYKLYPWLIKFHSFEPLQFINIIRADILTSTVTFVKLTKMLK